MDWASRRRFIILSLIGTVVVVLVVTTLATTFHKAPSCSDGVQNQSEAGVDCGGPCPYLCAEQAHVPTVLFTKAIPSGTGRTDVVASIENINVGAAAKDVPYTVTLYGTGQVFVQKVSGVLDLPPATTVPVFIPGITTGNQKVVRAFLSIDPAQFSWFAPASGERVVPVVTNTTLGGSPNAPRIDAVITNRSVTALADVRAVVLVRSKEGEVIAASETLVSSIPAQGQATATFTWNGAFSTAPAAIEVLPVIPLP